MVAVQHPASSPPRAAPHTPGGGLRVHRELEDAWRERGCCQQDSLGWAWEIRLQPTKAKPSKPNPFGEGGRLTGRAPRGPQDVAACVEVQMGRWEATG